MQGWGGSYRVGWVIQGWSWSCRGRGLCRGGVGESCRGREGGLCRGGEGCVM